MKYFGDVKKTNAVLPVWNDPIYKKEQLCTKTLLVPLQDTKSLTVTFPVPDQTKNPKSGVR